MKKLSFYFRASLLAGAALILSCGTSSAQLEWRVSVRIFTDANGNPPSAARTNVNTLQAITNRINNANTNLDAFGRGYRFRIIDAQYLAGATAPAPASTNSWFNVLVSSTTQDDLDAKVKASPGPLKYRTDAINFYVTGSSGGPNGGYCSFPNENQNTILVAQDSFSDVLIHESGHFLGLQHTHNTEQYLNLDNSACTNNCSCAKIVGGDEGNNSGVNDTPLDVRCWTRDQIALNIPNGNLYALLNSGQQYFVDNTWSNIMSYHSPGNRFTPDQLDVMTDISNGSRFNIATGRTRFVATAGNDGSGDGSSGNRYRTLAKGISVTAPGDIVLLQGGNYNEPQTIKRAVTLRATRGDVLIGRP